MAADAPSGPKGNPQFLGTGAPATAADLNAISTWAADNTGIGVADAAARDALPSWAGKLALATDTKILWADDGVGWTIPRAPLRLDRRSSNLAIANASTGDGTDVVLNEAVFDNLAEFVTYSAGVYTVVKACLLRLNVDLVWDAHATGLRILRLYWKPSSGAATWREQKIIFGTPGASSTFGQQVSWDIPLAIGNVVKVTARQNSGGALSLLGAATVPGDAGNNYSSMITVELIRPL